MKLVPIAAALAVSVVALSACTNDPQINAATGGLAGAAVGSQLGSGSGRVAATLGGAAVGTAVGANTQLTP
ncbi:MAG: glycine zipper 2TM domain-containing protein [Roseinatronobacter sp.]